MDTEKDSRVLPVSEVYSLRLPPTPQQLLGLLHADRTHPNIHTRKVSTPPGTVHYLHHTNTSHLHPHAAHAPPLPEPGGWGRTSGTLSSNGAWRLYNYFPALPGLSKVFLNCSQSCADASGAAG